ncbi:hypothetical protein J6590_023612 [Homalodisca vitripennis]|nr:hypothetical protein J6590_023612 [Homalodisca vitripennis]
MRSQGKPLTDNHDRSRQRSPTPTPDLRSLSAPVNLANVNNLISAISRTRGPHPGTTTKMADFMNSSIPADFGSLVGVPLWKARCDKCRDACGEFGTTCSRLATFSLADGRLPTVLSNNDRR